MKILILNWRDIKHPLAGGAEQSLYEHAKYWVKKGAVVDWYSSSWKGAKKSEEIDGIRFRRNGNHYTVHLLTFLEYFSGQMKDYDVVVDCFHFVPYFTPLYFQKKTIIALIHETAGKLWFDNLPFFLALLGYLSERFFFIFYKKVPIITVSESTKNDLTRFGISPNNIYVITNGTKIKKLKNYQKEKVPTLVFLGRISKDKGIQDAIKSYSIIKKTVPEAVFWIIGKEEKEGYLHNIIRSSLDEKERSDVTFFGFVSEEKKYELLSKSWVLLHPSKKEGWGLTVIEAARCFTPTVGYNVSGLKDSIHDRKTGILTNPNPQALAYEVIDLIKNQKKRKEISENAYQNSLYYNWDTSVKKSYALLRKIKNYETK